MIYKTRKKLIRMFLFFTGGILTCVFLILAIISTNDIKTTTINDFDKTIWTLSSKMQFENVLSTSWLSDYESSNDVMVSIDDNGVPFAFTAQTSFPTSREKLLAKLEHLSIDDGMPVEANHITSNYESTSLLQWKGEKHDSYYGRCIFIRNKVGYQKIYFIKQKPAFSFYLKTYGLYLGLDLLGWIMLFVAGQLVINKALEPVKKSQQNQAEFLAAASHELRSPLSVIRAQNSSTTTLTELPHTQTVIENECARMNQLISDMLLLASGDANTWSFNQENVDLDTLLFQVYDTYCTACEKKEITLSLDLPESSLPEITGDPMRIQQILSILIDNAISYSPNGSDIRLKATSSQHIVSIDVIDHGIGISDDDKEKIFNRFYRVDSSRTDKNHFGLGLSIALELVKLHHGKIEITDTEGCGSTFRVEFIIN